MKAKIVFGVNGKNTYFADGKEVTKAEFDELFPTKIKDLLKKGQCATTLMQTSGAWPRKSLAAGVHPSQVEEAYQESVRLGCATQYDRKTGRAIIESNGHQIRFNKAMGLINNDGGYNQVAG
jgi:hypothetical protein